MSHVVKKKVACLVSHPIQYHSPLFMEWAKSTDMDLTVIYCSNYGVEDVEKINPVLGKLENWDIPLLEGYNHVFMKNYSPHPSIFSGFFGLVNLGLPVYLKRQKIEVIIINGWNYFSCVYALIASKILGISVYIRGDNTIINEEIISGPKRFLKKIILGWCLFKLIDKFLYVGESNKEFFESYGVKKDKLIFAPHAIDNHRFSKDYIDLMDSYDEIRENLGIGANAFTIIFIGNLVNKKRPLDLLRAFNQLDLNNKHLIYIGIGPWKGELQDYISANNIQGVQLLGFKNQKEIGKYLRASNVFVLPSTYGETWGLVVNEAMNFHLPVIVSDRVGCSKNLVKPGVNGYEFKSEDIDDLTRKLKLVYEKSYENNVMGKESATIIKNYTYKQIIEAVSDSI